MIFAELTSHRLRGVDREQTVVLLPIAAIEQHGPHLPTGTDTIICGAVAQGVESRLGDSVLLLPTQWLGASSHHLRFGATLTAELTTYVTLLCEMVRPLLRAGHRRLLLLNGHGGNIDPMQMALRELQVEFPNALLAAASYWSIAADAIAERMEGASKTVGHACEAETSLILHLRPELVEQEAVANHDGWLPDRLEGMYVCRDMRQRTSQGATGRADLASAEKGAAMFAAIVERVSQAVERLRQEPTPE